MKLSHFVLVSLLTTSFCAEAFGQADPMVSNLIQQGDAHDRKFEPIEALVFYLAAEKIEPNNATLLLNIARQYRHQAADTSAVGDKLRLGRLALTYAKRGQALAANDSEAHLSVAISHAKMAPLLGNKERVAASREIRQAVDKAIKLDPGKDLAWHVLGSWHQRLAELGSLKRTMAKVLYGSLPEASYEQSVKCFQTAILLNPNRPMHHIELGRTYAQMGKKDEAKKAIQKGLSMPNVGKDDPDIKSHGRETLAAIK